MIYCRGCLNELWYDEEDNDGRKIHYVCMCNECDSAHLQLRDVLHDNFKAMEAGIVALSINVIRGRTGENERKIALRALESIFKIEDVLHKINNQ